MEIKAIHSDKAPEAIGAYSQAIRAGQTVYLSGQIPLCPASMALVSSDIAQQMNTVFDNLSAVAEAAGGALSDIVSLTVYLIDLQHFSYVNEAMAHYFKDHRPARATIGVASLPRGALVEISGIMVLQAG